MSDESFDRTHVAGVLRRAGLPDVADDVLRHLPDPVDRDVLENFLQARGLTKTRVTDLMGGSP